MGEYVKDNLHKNNDLGEYLRVNCQFKDATPSSEWVTTFMATHHLSLRKPSPLERARGEVASDPFIIYNFYDLLENEINKLHLQQSPSRVYNVNEIAFCLDPRGGKVVAPVGSKVHRATSTAGRTCSTGMECVSASGTALPPLIIFSAKHLYDSWKGQSAMPGTMYASSGMIVIFFLSVI
jgi:hypothetical protein